jgi:response regulator RpfG family c-di-GMP phosphodiesterase/methyl-accepting chemotaxis protein
MKKLSSKIFAIFISMLLTLFAMGIASYTATNTQTQHLYLTDLLGQEKYLLEKNIRETLHLGELALFAPDRFESQYERQYGLIQESSKSLDNLLEVLSSRRYILENGDVFLLDFTSEFNDVFSDATDKLISLWTQIKIDQDYLFNLDSTSNRIMYSNKLINLDNLSSELIKASDLVIKICEQAAEKQTHTSNLIQLFSISFSILVFIFLIIFIRSNFYKTIKNIKLVFKSMSLGDFKQFFSRKQDDEFKELYNNFNHFIDNLEFIFNLENNILEESRLDPMLLYIDSGFKKFMPFSSMSFQYIKDSKNTIAKHISNGNVSTINDCSQSLIKLETIATSNQKLYLPINNKNHMIGVLSFHFEKDIEQSSINFVKILEPKLTLGFYKVFLLDNLLGIVTRSLSEVTEARDPETGNHLIRMSKYSQIIAQKLHSQKYEPSIVDIDFVNNILITAPMHDIGKVGISDSILLKPGKLNEDERVIMNTHAEIGGKVLEHIDSQFKVFGINYFEQAVRIAYGHHEKYDGTGYPNGLSHKSIPIEARICAVADVFDALTSKRPYKEAFSIEKSLNILKEGREKHFDPNVLDAFFDSLDDILKIYDKYKEI